MRIDVLKHLNSRSSDTISTANGNAPDGSLLPSTTAGKEAPTMAPASSPGPKTNLLRLIRDKLLGVPDNSTSHVAIGSASISSRSTVSSRHVETVISRDTSCPPNGISQVHKYNYGTKSSTLPNRSSARRHTAHVTVDQIQQAAAAGINQNGALQHKSILKSPVKLIPPGRIEVIKEEVEIEVAANSCTSRRTSMHRSVEGPQIPAPVPPAKLSLTPAPYASNGHAPLSQPAPVSQLSSGPPPRPDLPVYTEPVIVPTTVVGKPRMDYLESLGSRLPFNDDDPGVMSEVDTTTTTAFHRGGRARASLPAFKTPSKTLEKPLGVVFLQYRDETKRTVLPNEVTTLDTVKALFVRAFPRLLTMQFLDCSDKRKIYILDQRKDMFYELEDLRDIRDRSVLKIFESDQIAQASSSAASSVYGPSHGPLSHLNSDEMHYYSEPEFEPLPESLRYSGLHSKSPRVYPPMKGTMSHSYPSSSNNPIPPPPYSSPPNVPPKPQRSSFGYATSLYDEPIYANTNTMEKRPPSRSGTATPIVDEEARYRVDAMERHLANLTGLVQQALSGSTAPAIPPRGIRPDYSNIIIPPKRNSVQKDQKSITPPVHATLNGISKLTKHASDLPNNQSQPAENGIFLRYPDPMLMEYLEAVQHKVRDMRADTHALRRQQQSQALSMREIIKENFERLKTQFNLVALPANAATTSAAGTQQRARTANEALIFQQDRARLHRDLTNLENSIDTVRSAAVDQAGTLAPSKPVSLRDVERCTTELNELSNNIADLRLKFPVLQEKIKTVMTADMEMVIRDEMFVKEEPEKLEEMAKRCQKLTGTLLSLNKLACVQDSATSPKEEEVLVDLPPESTPTSSEPAAPAPPTRRESLTTTTDKSKPGVDQSNDDLLATPNTRRHRLDKKAQDMLDDLLSELEVFTDVSSREPTPDRDATIKRSPKATAKIPSTDTGFLDLNASLSPPSITPSNSSQSTATTLSSMTETSSNFSGSDSGTTISKLQVGVGDRKTTISPVPFSNRSAASSGMSTPARKGSDADRSLSAWLNNVNLPAPPPRSSSKSPLISPMTKTSGFFTLPSNYGRSTSTMSEPGDFQSYASLSYNEYTNLGRELRASNIKDQRLTPQQQDKIASYYTSKLRKGSDPGNTLRSPIDDIASDILAFEASKGNYARSESRERRVPPALPPKPGQEDPGVAPPLPPRNRQEILEERHQELLKKQRQLQEQYARLQQLQRDQKLRPSSPVNKPSTTPQSGSLTDLKRQHMSKMNELYAVPTSVARPFRHPMTMSNGSTGEPAQQICETDIL